MSRIPLSFLVLAVLILQMIKTYAKVSSIIVFGDSTVDPGNNNYISTIAKSNFKPYGRDFNGGQPTGRFCNGRLATDIMSEAFGLKPTIPAYLDLAYNIKDFATGVCFASAGTGFDNATSDVLNVIPLWKEMEYYKEYQQRLKDYLGADKAQNVLSEALYIISIGTNDFLENYYVLPRRSLEYSVEEYQDFLLGIARNFVVELYQLGGRKMSLTGLPPMGCLPLERTKNIRNGAACNENYNSVAKEFNVRLQGLVQNLNKELSGMQLVFTNPYDTLLDIIQNPNAYGFENVALGCCGTGIYEMGYLCLEANALSCPDASKYAFWDSFHPTEKTNSILADYAMKNSIAVFR